MAKLHRLGNDVYDIQSGFDFINNGHNCVSYLNYTRKNEIARVRYSVLGIRD